MRLPLRLTLGESRRGDADNEGFLEDRGRDEARLTFPPRPRFTADRASSASEQCDLRGLALREGEPSKSLSSSTCMRVKSTSGGKGEEGVGGPAGTGEDCIIRDHEASGMG